MCLFLALFSFLVLSAASPHTLRELEQAGNHTKPFQRRYHYNANLVTWPQDSDSFIHTIPYCFADSIAYDQLSYLVYNAIQMWTDKLGVPGKANGHAVRIVEHQITGKDQDPFCFLWDPNSGWSWNTLFDEGTLTIIHDLSVSVGAIASIGYDYPGDGIGNNRLTVNTGGFPEDEGMIPVIAHEIGHTLGLLHEHQRSDRDKYISFDCSNLDGYQEAVDKIRAQGNKVTIDQVCDDQKLAAEYDFVLAREYARRMYSNEGTLIETVASSAFDYDSIMLYDSMLFINPAKVTNNMEVADLVLARWKNPNQVDIPAHRDDTNADDFHGSVVISDLDKQAIRELYPWRGS